MSNSNKREPLQLKAKSIYALPKHSGQRGAVTVVQRPDLSKEKEVKDVQAQESAYTQVLEAIQSCHALSSDEKAEPLILLRLFEQAINTQIDVGSLKLQTKTTKEMFRDLIELLIEEKSKLESLDQDQLSRFCFEFFRKYFSIPENESAPVNEIIMKVELKRF